MASKVTERVPPPFPNDKRKNLMSGYLLFIEGMIRHYEAVYPDDDQGRASQNRRMGWGISQQIVAQYVVEMLLRIRLVLNDHPDRELHSHNLRHLYNKLTREEQARVEGSYVKFLHNDFQWTWAELQTVASFLKFLGPNPIKSTRYPYQRGGSGVTLFAARCYRPLIYALFVGLFDYPVRDKLEDRYNTEFRSFKDSIKNQQR